MVVTSVAFGVVHQYQGSLLPGMAMHALIDLRIVALFFVMPRPRYGIEGAKGG